MIRRFLVALVLLAVIGISWLWISLPNVSSLAKTAPKTTAFMQERQALLRKEGKSDRIDYRWVPLDRISPALRRAVLVSEDSGFYEHGGIDTKQIEDAISKGIEKGHVPRGASTITQQLARNLYLSPSKNPIRKLRELLITWELERHLSKRRILEIYLNVVEFGERTYGAEAAARHYFGVSAGRLDPEQAALLAGCLPNPRRMNPGHPNRTLRRRQRIILSRMIRWGTEAEREMFEDEMNKSEPVPLTPEPPASSTAGPSTAPATSDTAFSERPSSTETSTTPAPRPDAPPPAVTQPSTLPAASTTAPVAEPNEPNVRTSGSARAPSPSRGRDLSR